MTALALDHLVIAVRDLDVATKSYRLLLGREPSWRGLHPSYGTANVLFRLNNTYLELLAPAAGGADSPWQRTLREHLDSRGEGLYAIALGTDDIEEACAAARAQGAAVDDPADGSGVDIESGARREWRNARIAEEATRGVHAFFIEHGSPSDTLPLAEPKAERGAYALGIDHTVVASSHLDRSLWYWQQALGLDLRLTLDQPSGRRLHFLRLGDSILELAGEAEPASPGERDVLWGVAYRVGDVACTVARLRSAGLAISEPRAGNAPGTVVADLKPGFSHDVRTLFIQKDGAS